MKKYKFGLKQQIIIPVISISTIIYILLLSVLGTKLYNNLKTAAQNAIQLKAREYANFISGQLENEIVTTRSMAYFLELQNFEDKTVQKKMTQKY